MTVKSYLRYISKKAIIRNSKKESIATSIDAISSRIDNHFGNRIEKHFIFGSYNRGTILPRSMDSDSDVDYMVVFSKEDYSPQTYLNKLRRFAQRKYSTSEIKQSNPTIILSLNHINFELVPAIITEFWGGPYRIPDKAQNINNWIETDPLSMETSLVSTNKSNDFLIKPLIRLYKYWNASQNYPFEPFKLEKDIIEYANPFNLFLQLDYNLEEYFFGYAQEMSHGFFSTTSKREKISRLKQLSKQVKNHRKKGMGNKALKNLKKILPPV